MVRSKKQDEGLNQALDELIKARGARTALDFESLAGCRAVGQDQGPSRPLSRELGRAAPP